ncbi:MAG: hypothetical protein JNN20_18060 [Betaproteobacteria bacterium]|nr:hypothetical protein [Betaproteobacteria bacterium]
MAAIPLSQPLTHAPATRGLQLIGGFGALLAILILGSSMLLRLNTQFATDGAALSTLPPAIENAARLLHRLSASGVGVLAITAAALLRIRRPLLTRYANPLKWIIATTVLLSVIGPLTPGYRVAAITVGNVAGGMALLAACWWLRESVALPMRAQPNADPLPTLTLAVFMAQVATGALASAGLMRESPGFAIVHLGSAILATMFIGALAWSRRKAPECALVSIVVAGLLLAQVGLGVALMAQGKAAVALAYVHGMLSPLMATSLVSLVLRNVPAPPAPPRDQAV